MKVDLKDIEKWLNKTQSLVLKYLSQNEDKQTPVIKYRPPQELKESMDVSLGKPLAEEELWKALERILDNSVRTTHPLFLNQLFGGLRPEAITAEWISTVLNPTMATYEIAPYMTILEKEVARKLSNLMGLKLGEGIMVTGGSNANLVGLLCARQFKVPDIKKPPRGWPFSIGIQEE